jgi:hypothetical protein
MNTWYLLWDPLHSIDSHSVYLNHQPAAVLNILSLPERSPKFTGQILKEKSLDLHQKTQKKYFQEPKRRRRSKV